MHAHAHTRPPQVPYKYVDDLATVWCEWAEMELRHHNYSAARALMHRATAAPQRSRKLSQAEERLLPVQERLYRCVCVVCVCFACCV
jgi:pre-mRNA-splicing factor SYF1